MLTASLAAQSQNCEKVKLSDFPKTDLPKIIDTSHSMQAQLKENGSYKFYYGIGVPVDYVKARQLAFIEMALNNEKDDIEPFTGASILMMLYANGYGVNRNLDLSIRLACANVGFAEAEIEGRMEHLKKMKSGESKEVFDLCDDITSGYMTGYCAGVHSQLDKINRQAIIDSVIKSWSEKEKAAYATLRKAASGFFTERVMSEVDMSGTARVAEEVGEEESLEEDFKDKIIAANKCAFDPYTTQQWEAADQKLNSAYTKIMKITNPHWGTVTKQGIRSTQRDWIAYRDAWITFAAVKCPQISTTALKTLLTTERTDQLEEWNEK